MSNLGDEEELVIELNDEEMSQLAQTADDMALVVRAPTPCRGPKRKKTGKGRAKRMKTKVPLFRPRPDPAEEIVTRAPAILPAPEGPQLFGGNPIVGGSSTGNRHSVAMKLRLRQIEQNVARMMQERKRLGEVKDILLSVRTKMRREEERLDGMMRHVHTTAQSRRSPQVWQDFFENHFFVPDNYHEYVYLPEDDNSEASDEDETFHAAEELDLD